MPTCDYCLTQFPVELVHVPTSNVGLSFTVCKTGVSCEFWTLLLFGAVILDEAEAPDQIPSLTILLTRLKRPKGEGILVTGTA